MTGRKELIRETCGLPPFHSSFFWLADFIHTSSGQVVLAGDPLQLGPVILSPLASSMGLAESFLSRLLQHFPYQRDAQGFPHNGGYNPRLITRLSLNYRSVPEILHLPNSLFYDSYLQPQVHEAKVFYLKLEMLSFWQQTNVSIISTTLIQLNCYNVTQFSKPLYTTWRWSATTKHSGNMEKKTLNLINYLDRRYSLLILLYSRMPLIKICAKYSKVVLTSVRMKCFMQ